MVTDIIIDDGCEQKECEVVIQDESKCKCRPPMPHMRVWARLNCKGFEAFFEPSPTSWRIVTNAWPRDLVRIFFHVTSISKAYLVQYGGGAVEVKIKI